MIRRQFIRLATLASATGVASLGRPEIRDHDFAVATERVTWRVQGFTCITCAVGLETMLSQQKGVRSAKASYPDASVRIQFEPTVTGESTLRSFISELGFAVDERTN
jgi:copper chaperone CopZ